MDTSDILECAAEAVVVRWLVGGRVAERLQLDVALHDVGAGARALRAEALGERALEVELLDRVVLIEHKRAVIQNVHLRAASGLVGSGNDGTLSGGTDGLILNHSTGKGAVVVPTEDDDADLVTSVRAAPVNRAPAPEALQVDLVAIARRHSVARGDLSQMGRNSCLSCASKTRRSHVVNLALRLATRLNTLKTTDLGEKGGGGNLGAGAGERETATDAAARSFHGGQIFRSSALCQWLQNKMACAEYEIPHFCNQKSLSNTRRREKK